MSQKEQKSMEKITSQLDNWIKQAEEKAKVFNEKGMLHSETSSLSMAQAYRNVKKFIVENNS